MRRGRPTNFLDLFIILTLVLGVRAVSAGELGSLKGQVVQSGTAVALQASVSIRCGGTQRSTMADGSGAFSFTGLPLGSCTVTATLAGFSPAAQAVTVTSKEVSVKLVMAVAAVTKKPEPKPAADESKSIDKKEMASPSTPPMVAPSPMKVKRAVGYGSGSARSGAVMVGGKGSVAANRPAPGPMVQQEEGEDFNTEGYSRIDDNPFRLVSADPLSTFSSDVDTASYSNLRRFLRDGQLPPKDAVRIEEMINYFSYDYPAPKGNDPFSITTEVTASPWTPKHQLVRVGLQAPAIDDRQVPARNLVFLLDVSGSMSDPNKLPLLKQAMNLLVDNLRPEDKVSIAVYAGAEGMALAPTSGKDKDKIRQAIFALESGGSTNGAAGIQLAYNMAEANKIKNGINRVILATDGDFNVGTTSEGELTRLIEKERERGIFLTVLGFGMGNLKDSTMEKLADRGNGNYGYIDSISEARKILVKEAGATLVTVAKDVKLQVEFNPALVAGYRLIGYENRLLRNEDFNDDKKDAGDIGAGHSVTALYEIVPVGVKVPTEGKVDDLKYQQKAAPAAAANNGELLTVKVRYKEPNGSTSKLLSQPVKANDKQGPSTDMQWAAAMAGFGMLLRESPHKGQLTWNQVLAIATSSTGKDPEGYRKQAVQMIEQAAKLKRK